LNNIFGDSEYSITFVDYMKYSTALALFAYFLSQRCCCVL